MEDKLKTVHQELAQATQQYTELQSTFENERAVWVNDKKELEGTIFDMGTSEKHSESDRVLFESEVRQQEERVKVCILLHDTERCAHDRLIQAVEERYSREVVAHAETIKALQEVKAQLAGAQTKATESIAAAETAKANLSASEASWKHQKEILEKELADLTSRSVLVGTRVVLLLSSSSVSCKDLKGQNETLHNHLESVSSQAARIRQTADASAIAANEDGLDDADTKLSELHGVVAYLRKENEIKELQLDLSKQELARLKSQIEALSVKLQEAAAAAIEVRHSSQRTNSAFNIS